MAADEFGPLAHVIIDPRDLGLAHAVGPHEAGPQPLRVMNQDMKRRALQRNAGLLEADAHLRKDIVDEALVAGAVGQPVDDAVGQRRGGILVWCAHILPFAAACIKADIVRWRGRVNLASCTDRAHQQRSCDLADELD
ncbi:hypothetical protein ACVIWV_005647 [Bradyrhizobium diazoefficiens]